MLPINTRGIVTDTVALTDYEVLSASLAKVVISFTGKHSKESIAASLSEQMKYLAAPVENSFRQVRAGVAVGFVRSNRTIRTIDSDKELRASYRVMAGSNILMDNADKTLWEVRDGKAGKYLARHGNEDLSELVEASVARRSDIPSLHAITMATAVPREFVSFASASGDMDYGFCVQASKDKLRVVSSSQSQAIVIPHSVVAGIYQVGIQKSDNDRLVKAGLSRGEKDKEIEYYKRLYSYAPDYLREVVSQIEEGTLV